MTIPDWIIIVSLSFGLGFQWAWLSCTTKVLVSNSRLKGKLNQKEWQIMHWQLAYNKANNDFMRLAEIHNSVINPEGELNDC